MYCNHLLLLQPDIWTSPAALNLIHKKASELCCVPFYFKRSPKVSDFSKGTIRAVIQLRVGAVCWPKLCPRPVSCLWFQPKCFLPSQHLWCCWGAEQPPIPPLTCLAVGFYMFRSLKYLHKGLWKHSNPQMPLKSRHACRYLSTSGSSISDYDQFLNVMKGECASEWFINARSQRLNYNLELQSSISVFVLKYV